MMTIKNILVALLFSVAALPTVAQVTYGELSPLHVDGKYFKDQHGNRVVLHGVMDTPNMWFNGEGRYWGGGYNSTGQSNCLGYFEKLLTAVTDTTQGAYCNIFRLHLDPAWTNGNDNTWPVDDRERVTDKSSEAYFAKYTGSQLTSYLKTLYFPLAVKAMKHGMYVIMRPPGVCPPNIYVGGSYQKYLLDVWDRVTKNDSIRKYSGQISLELANEPIHVFNADGSSNSKTLYDFFQPIVDKMRANGYTGIILIPGTGYQSDYRSYETYPITGNNIGYAVHVYSGWYGMSDDHYTPSEGIQNFLNQVPVVKNYPIVVTEVDWSPQNSDNIKGHNEMGQPVYGNYGTWATGSTSKWGKFYKALLDYCGNISMTLTHPHDFIDIDTYLNTWNNTTKRGTVLPAFKAAMEANGLDVYEASSGACFQWYKEYYFKDYPGKAYKRAWTADRGNGKFVNPIVNGDFPDVDVIRVDDTYYMVSTTMYHFPGATILKSKDLVNWEYCANPLEQILDNDAYSLLNGKHHYAQGMWASSLTYHDGKFYLYFPCSTWSSDSQSILLTATNPEGKWDVKRLGECYHDPGWLFDDGENGDGYLYVACGINDIWVNKFNAKTLQKVGSERVLSVGDKGLEGTHMYHIGDYYYLYCTYNHGDGTRSNTAFQTIFRATSPMGPYEECPYAVFANQNIHQGALVQTQTGEWWTVLFKDAGAIGRAPYLEPVTWTDGWPLIGKKAKVNGVETDVDVSRNSAVYAKPNVGATYSPTYLPTSDTFIGIGLGMQWQWNHNPDNSAWSIMERPGYLRLRTASVTDNLSSARGSLTQRILGYSPEGTSSSRVLNSYGTIKMDISQMQEGDIAGLAVFQNPYSLIGVKMQDGKKYLYSQRCTFSGQTHEVAETQTGDEVTADVIYLRAIVNFGTNACNYYYSYDNTTWKKWGVTMKMGYTLDYFVGQRFYLFNFATQALGGYVDIDWFSTEPTYTEERFYAPGTLKTYTEEDLTMDKLAADTRTLTMLSNSAKAIHITCTAKSGLKQDVTAACQYTSDNPKVAVVRSGRIVSFEDGDATITATYTDMMGNSQSLTIKVTVSTFPLKSDDFNPAVYGSGTYSTALKALTTSQYGFGGWRYENGIDLSPYNYIVVKIKRKSSSKPSFRIFDQDSYWSDPYILDFNDETSLVIDLHNMKNSKGETIDPSHIYMAGFWSEGGTAIYIDNVFLSMDGVNTLVITDIQDVPETREATVVRTEIFSLNGHLLARPEKGVNILRTTYSDGTMKTEKIMMK